MKKPSETATALKNNDFVSNKTLCKFLKESIFLLINTKGKKELIIPSFTSIIRNGYSFRGFSRDVTNFPGWAIFQWIDSKKHKYGAPGKIITFLDLSTIQLKHQFRNEYAVNELHVIIESMKILPKQLCGKSFKHLPICCHADVVHTKATGEPQYYLVSVNTILSTCYVIPDLGNNNKNKYIYVYPRYMLSEQEEEKRTDKEKDYLLTLGWKNKF